MQVPKIILTAAAFAGFCLAGAQQQPSDTNPPAPTNTPALLRATIRSEGGQGQITSPRAYLSSGTNQLAFLVPAGFGLDESDPQKIVLTRPGLCRLTVRMSGPIPDGGLQASVCRQNLLSEHPGAKVREEFALPGANRSGPALDIAFVTSAGLPRAGRFVYIPFRMGIVEFSCETSPDKFDESLPHLNYIMVTLRSSDEQGKIDSTPL